ncbi:MAG: mlaD [Rickettsiaceae bacterium]|jgi:phospholipid/cholesterol/gamma-HCH transport system substrate-binding protein|nr:mlaD [Rickettsiaceae bacterium]
MGRSVVETLMGAVVLLVAATFVFISYKSGNISPAANGYTVKAKFREIGSLSVGSDVRVGGIKIGTISGQSLDPKNYMAIIELNIKSDVKLPKDSSAAVVGDGLMGGKYIAIQPGGEEEFIEANGEIKYTQDAISIEELIGKFAFGSVGSKSGSEGTEKGL